MIVHTVSSIDNEATGPAYSVPRLCESLLALGLEARLAVLDWNPGAKSPPYVDRFPLGLGPRKLGRSPAMERWLRLQVRSGKVHILHTHGLWMMPNLYPGRVRAQGGVRLVISPRGMASQWAMNHHRWRKRLMWYLGQGATFKRADAFHATADSEYEDIRRLGFRQPVAVIPNGINVPPLEPKPCCGRTRLLYLGRIHEKKGIDLLLRAWHVVYKRFPAWDLIIAGPDDGGCLPRLQQLSRALGLQRVEFRGPVYGAEKLALYRSAHLFVLPTHSENFAMTVAEALAAGTPAVVTRGAPWPGLVERRCGWWIDIGVEPLIDSLQEALSMPLEGLARMGADGHAWMGQEFGWENIGRRMAAFYDWVLKGGKRPEWVRD